MNKLYKLLKMHLHLNLLINKRKDSTEMWGTEERNYQEDKNKE